MGFWHSLKKGLKSIGQTVKHAAKWVGHNAQKGWQKAEKAIGTLHKDARDAAEAVGGFVNKQFERGFQFASKVEKDVAKFGSKGLDTITGLGKSLSLPLVAIGIGAVVVGGVILTRR